MRALDYHLYSRNGKLYYRCALPTALKPFLPFKEIVLSLGTSDPAQGRLYVAKLDIQVSNLIESIYATLKHSPSKEGIEKVKILVTGCLDDLRQSVGLENIRKSPHWYSSSLEAKSGTGSSRLKPNTLSKISEEYLEECITNTRRTIEQKRVAYELFVAIIGDLPLEKVTRKHARRYKSILLKTPPNYLKKQGYTSYSQVDWANLPEGAEVQSFKTLNSKIMPLISLYSWASKNDLYEGSNPFAGMLLKETGQTKNKRVAYKNEKLKALFSHYLFSRPNSDDKYKDYHYWIPIIGLYSGMRLNEICQLEKSDIEEIEGIWCFNINDSDEKSVKTSSSIRLVPIHSKLVELGLLEYVKGKKEGRIFDDLEMAYNGTYSYTFTKWYSRFLSRIGIKKRGLCFHSFRHTFIDELRSSGVERSIAMKLVGHGSKNDIHASYGYGYSLKILEENLNKINFDLTLNN